MKSSDFVIVLQVKPCFNCVKSSFVALRVPSPRSVSLVALRSSCVLLRSALRALVTIPVALRLPRSSLLCAPLEHRTQSGYRLSRAAPSSSSTLLDPRAAPHRASRLPHRASHISRRASRWYTLGTSVLLASYPALHAAYLAFAQG